MKQKYAYRVRIAQDIIAEVMPPARASRKAIILCDGLPSVPSKRAVVNFLSERGYWVFYPRYRGAWESDGVFLKQSPVRDIFDVTRTIREGKIVEEYARATIRFAIKDIFVVGASFGGAVALCAAPDKRIKKVAALSPVVDFRNVRGQDIQTLESFTKRAFGRAYTISHSGWKKMDAGKLFNPVSEMRHLDPKKILIMHSQDDEVVGAGPVRDFARELGCAYREFRKRGHMSAGVIMNRDVWMGIKKFLS